MEGWVHGWLCASMDVSELNVVISEGITDTLKVSFLPF